MYCDALCTVMPCVQVTVYGGNLRFTLRYRPGSDSTPLSRGEPIVELGVSLALSASLSVHCHACLPGYKPAVKLGVCLPHSLFTAMLVFLG